MTMRILVEPSDYTLFNIGDTAMLQIAIQRLNELFPDATIHVYTHDPVALAYYCPQAIPLNTEGRDTWLRSGFLFGRLYNLSTSKSYQSLLQSFEQKLRQHYPKQVEQIIRLKLRIGGWSSNDFDHFLTTITQSDLLIGSGMGGITDSFTEYAVGILNIFSLAIHNGVPTALFGQGIGPIKQPNLRQIAQEILPKLDLIALREQRAGLPLLQSLNVSPSRILVTGDDAIEPSFRARSETLGNGLGVNLRIASYSAVDQTFIDELRPALQEIARKFATPLLPIPISRVAGEEDMISIQKLINNAPNDGAPSPNTAETFDTQEKLIKQISRCRVVFTGSYHAAVFALAQGIPSVCLAKSNYYVDKFQGLADQFGAGCEVINLNEGNTASRVTSAIERSWQAAETLRPLLLDAASQQIDQSRAAYFRLHDIIRKTSK